MVLKHPLSSCHRPTQEATLAPHCWPPESESLLGALRYVSPESSPSNYPGHAQLSPDRQACHPHGNHAARPSLCLSKSSCSPHGGTPRRTQPHLPCVPPPALSSPSPVLAWILNYSPCPSKETFTDTTNWPPLSPASLCNGGRGQSPDR